ncbi:hypothetical protein EYV94_07405 [Puteibacter caeruleilacunae]|nr:hypothetical protein EYV94_07405 [Puteibacter caeruleilacunae]
MQAEKIKLLNEQITKLTARDFRLEAWKVHTIILLDNFFGKDNNKSQLIDQLKADYSSWNLRDATGGNQQADPIKQLAKEILEAAIQEISLEVEEPTSPLTSALQDELSGKEFSNLQAFKKENNEEEIAQFVKSLSKKKLENIITNLIFAQNF